MTQPVERLTINTSTTGIEIGVYPARFADRMFAETAALGLCSRYDRERGSTLPVVVGDVSGTAGADDANEWGTAFNEVGEGARRAVVDPGFGDSVKFDSHDITWRVVATFEMVRDMADFEGWLEGRAAYFAAQHLLWRAASGSGSGQGHGVRTALNGDSANTNGAGTVPTAEELRAMRFEGPAAAYRSRPSCAWWTSDAMLDDLAGLSDGGERLLKFDSVPPGAEATLYGRPVYSVPGFAHGANVKGTIAFGDFSCMGVGLVGGLRADQSADVMMNEDKIAFRFSLSYDTQLVDPAGIVLFDSGS